ncbi:MAG: hypothetical protein VB056_10985 [Sphaerochaeta associata]|nr:hypothetical protein [Sphaerochaeta associata]MEA5029395.1 hypothetical protein [Sphaerochaeta associata]
MQPLLESERELLVGFGVLFHAAGANTARRPSTDTAALFLF